MKKKRKRKEVKERKKSSPQFEFIQMYASCVVCKSARFSFRAFNLTMIFSEVK